MKNPRRALLNGGLAVVIVAALAVAGILLFKPFSATTASATGTQLTSTVQQGTVSSTVSASGAIDPASTTSVSFAVSGTITSVDVAVGQTVAVGQALGAIDATSLQATVNADYQAYVYAGQDLTAAETAANPQVSQINSAKLSRTQALNTYTAAKTQLAETTLTSPVAGLVVAVNGTVGGSSGGSSSSTGTGSASSSSSSTSSSNSGFVTIADVSHDIVTANIAEADIANVTVGQTATVTFPAMTGVTATAKVTAIAPTATASNSVVTYATTITLDSVPAKVRLGQTATVAITVATSASTALYVPAAAITTASDGTSTVKVVDSKTGATSAVPVTTGVIGDAGTEIKSGLTAGETIVIGTVSASTSTSTTGTGAGAGGGFGGAGGGFGGAGGGFRTRGGNG
jgi:macrolide-specific efflux system membrane fusion protein